jgi:hypothetical protein
VYLWCFLYKILFKPQIVAHVKIKNIPLSNWNVKIHPCLLEFQQNSASNCHLQPLAFQAVGWEGTVSFLASMFPLLQLEATQLVWSAEYNARKQAAMQHIHEQYRPYKIIHLTKSKQLNITNCPYISWCLLAWLMLRNSQRTNASHNDCTLQRKSWGSFNYVKWLDSVNKNRFSQNKQPEE